MLRSIDSLDPCRMTTVKDLYCLYRTGQPRLQLLDKHYKLLVNLGFNPEELYNRILTDLSMEELKLITLITLDRITFASMFSKDGKIHKNVIALFDTLRVFECLASTLFGSKFTSHTMESLSTFFDYKRKTLRYLGGSNWKDKILNIQFFCPPENYVSFCYSSSVKYGYRVVNEGFNVEGLEPWSFKDSRSGTYVKSRPFRKFEMYPLLEETRAQYRLRDMMYGLDQNTCNAWLKRTKTKLKSTKMSEEELLNFFHIPIHSLTEKDIELAKFILNLTKTEQGYIRYFEDNLKKFEECKLNNWNFNVNRYLSYYKPELR